MSWCLIESDPAVFWEILHSLDCHSLDFEELWCSDEDVIRQSLLSKSNSDDLRGLIFLYRYGTITQKDSFSDESGEQKPIFIKQVIENSCATQALLSVALNQPDRIALGDTLQTFKELILHLDAETRGWALGNHADITRAHNVFGATSQLTTSEGRNKKTELPFHYVAYVPFGGYTYLLDGLRAGPVMIGGVKPGRPWYGSALNHIKESIASSANQEITFNLIGVTESTYPLLKRELEEDRSALRNEMATGHPDCNKINQIVSDLDKAKGAMAQWRNAKKALLADNEIRKMSMIPLYIEVLRLAVLHSIEQLIFRTLAGRGLLTIFDSN